MWSSTFIFVLSVVLIENVLESDSISSGIYIDNGLDQTIMQHELTRSEKQEMETELLNILGLPNRPPHKISSSAKLKKSATKYMIEIYKSLMEKENSPSRLTRSADLNITHQDLNIVDAVMTFESHDKHVSGVRHERGKRLWFDVSEVPAGEMVLDAELRIYQNYILPDDDTKYTIAVYQVTKSDRGERELEFITALNTTLNHVGWLEFNITDSFNSWVAFPHSNKGLYLSVHPAENPAHEIKTEEIGLISVKGDDDDKQPFLVVFFKSSPHLVKVRKPRGTTRKAKSEYSPSNPAYYLQSNEASQQISRNCQIQMLYVSFKELQWQDWIIAPQGFEAFYCKGECNFPLNAHMNATNHAIVQTLVHLMNPKEVPKPCCAPTKLSAISVLYFADDTDVVLRKYRNIVVKSCGCH